MPLAPDRGSPTRSWSSSRSPRGSSDLREPVHRARPARPDGTGGAVLAGVRRCGKGTGAGPARLRAQRRPARPAGVRCGALRRPRGGVRGPRRPAPSWEPGTAHAYHAVTFGWLLAELIRRVTGSRPNQFLQDEICTPLQVEAWIGAPPEVDSRLADVVPEDPIALDRRRRSPPPTATATHVRWRASSGSWRATVPVTTRSCSIGRPSSMRRRPRGPARGQHRFRRYCRRCASPVASSSARRRPTWAPTRRRSVTPAQAGRSRGQIPSAGSASPTRRTASSGTST